MKKLEFWPAAAEDDFLEIFESADRRLLLSRNKINQISAKIFALRQKRKSETSSLGFSVGILVRIIFQEVPGEHPRIGHKFIYCNF